MRLDLEAADVKPLVETVVKETIAIVQPQQQPQRLLYSEAETAAMCGLTTFFLKKARQEGQVTSHSTRRPITYTPEQVQAIKEWLAER